MKLYFILFFSLFATSATCGCELPHDPFQGLTLDQEIKESRLKEERLKLLWTAFNKRFPLHKNNDFEERVKAIEDTSHPLRRNNAHLAQAYIALKLEDQEVYAIGVISSMRQLNKVLGFEYNYLLRTTPHILLNHFKCVELADGEIIDIGALLLGTHDMKIMMEVIKYDIKNDFIEMTQKAYKGKLNE